MTEDSVSDDNSGAVAFLMEAANASVEDATLAFERSGGNKRKALKLLTSGGDNFVTHSGSTDASTAMAQQDTGTRKTDRYFFTDALVNRKSLTGLAYCSHFRFHRRCQRY
jgi:hypothetical protein